MSGVPVVERGRSRRRFLCWDGPMSHSARGCVGGGDEMCSTDAELQSQPPPPKTLLSHLFVFVLITALRAATGTPLAFMRLMKVSADGNGAALLCVHTHGFVNLQALPD